MMDHLGEVIKKERKAASGENTKKNSARLAVPDIKRLTKVAPQILQDEVDTFSNGTSSNGV